MVEHGIIKWFRRSRQFGFIAVTDENGKRTGEEIWFHENDELGACDREFSNELDLAVLPTIGTLVVFERTTGRNNRPKAHWARKDNWLRISWRIVQKVAVFTGTVEFANTVDEKYHEEITETLRTGTSDATLEEIQRWTAATLGFFAEDASPYEHAGQVYRYYLQTKQGGKWTDVKGLNPIPETPMCSSCNDHGCDECQPDYYEDDSLSYTEIFQRARQAGFKPEQAREVASMLPGDFI